LMEQKTINKKQPTKLAGRAKITIFACLFKKGLRIDTYFIEKYKI